MTEAAMPRTHDSVPALKSRSHLAAMQGTWKKLSLKQPDGRKHHAISESMGGKGLAQRWSVP
jgi:hypothetical protein